MVHIHVFERLRALRTFNTWLLPAILLLIAQVNVAAQDWRPVLDAEMADNAQKITAIKRQGDQIWEKLQQANRAVRKHTDTDLCVYQKSHPEQCDWYVNEADQLNAQRESLRSQLHALTKRMDELVARNEEINRRLNCVQVPIPCSSNRDCTCSQSCGHLEVGEPSDPIVCQRRPR